jgi:hypothetical protein
MRTHRKITGGSGPIALSVGGQFFRANGQSWTGIACSDFTLLKRWLAGETITDILEDRVATGFNELRLWTLNQSVVGQVFPEGIHPNQYPDFYEATRKLVDLMASYGLVAEVTAFTSCVPLMPNVADQHKHWTALCDAVRGADNVKLELVNEYDWGNGENCPDKSLWDMRPSGILASSGSSTADAPPPVPVWDYVLYHSNGLDEFQRKVGHNTMEWADSYHCPGSANENTRFPDQDRSTIHAYDAAAGAALLCAGATFHSNSGKWSMLFDRTGSPSEYDCAVAWCDGAKSVPLEFQAGAYHHRTDLEGNTVIRAYDRTLSDGRQHVVLIHA